MTPNLQHLLNPVRANLPVDGPEFLHWLGGPAIITLPGEETGRSRMVVTLLHGNEPSGLKAMLRYIHSGLTPAVTLHFVIVSVATALHPPLFSHRQLPGKRDMNRTFRPPFSDEEGILARNILHQIDSLKPEVIIDIHNTSGDGPPFSVSPVLSDEHVALTHYFTHRMVVTDLSLGSLMEISRPERPAITIECGGANNVAADAVAFAGLSRLAAARQLFPSHSELELDLYHHPVRLQLLPGCTICYSARAGCYSARAGRYDERADEHDIRLDEDIDQRNFGMITPDIPLAWINNPACLVLKTSSGLEPIDDFFTIRHGRLYAAHPLKLFMVTTNAEIAKSDCLLYAVKERDHKWQHFPAHG